MTVAKSASTMAVEPMKKGSSLQKALGRYKNENTTSTKRKMTQASKQQHSSNKTHHSANGTETSGLVFATSPRKNRNKNKNSPKRTPTMKHEPGKQQHKRKQRPAKKKGGGDNNNDASSLQTNNNNRCDNGKETEQQMMKSTNYHFVITAAATTDDNSNQNCSDNISSSKRLEGKSSTRQGKESLTREGVKSPTRHAGKSPTRQQGNKSPTGQTVSKNKPSSSIQEGLGEYKGDPESNSEETGKDSEQKEETNITTGPIAAALTITETSAEEVSSEDTHKIDSKTSNKGKQKVESEDNSENKASSGEGARGDHLKCITESSDSLNEASDEEREGRDNVMKQSVESATMSDTTSEIVEETKQKMELNIHSNINDTTTVIKTSEYNIDVGVSRKISDDYSSSKETKQEMELENYGEPRVLKQKIELSSKNAEDSDDDGEAEKSSAKRNIESYAPLVDTAVNNIFPCDGNDDDSIDSNVKDRKVSPSGEVASVKDELDENYKRNQPVAMKTDGSNGSMNSNDDDYYHQEMQQQKQAPLSPQQDDIIAAIAPTTTVIVKAANTNHDIIMSNLELKMNAFEEKTLKMMKYQEEDQRIIHNLRMTQEAEQLEIHNLRLAQEENQRIIQKLQTTHTEHHEIIDELQNSVKNNEKQQVSMSHTFRNLMKIFKGQ